MPTQLCWCYVHVQSALLPTVHQTDILSGWAEIRQKQERSSFSISTRAYGYFGTSLLLDHFWKNTGKRPSLCLRQNKHEVENFRRNVRGTLQAGIRVDISVARLVAAMSGKASLITVEDFFKTSTLIRKEAEPVVKHYGSLSLNCREKPLCYYAQWS